MWEYFISFTDENRDCADLIFHRLKNVASDFGSVVTLCDDDVGFVKIMLACDEFDKVRMSYAINDAIVFCISTEIKRKFIEKYLSVPLFDEIKLSALKDALISFDRDTDIHLIQKYLVIDSAIFIESFFDFKLLSLKAKWFELIKLANENGAFLLDDDTYFELLKFLIDNLEVSFDQVNVLLDDDVFKLYDNSFNFLNSSANSISLVSKLVSLSPKNINIYSSPDYSSDVLSFLLRAFDGKIKLLPKNLFCSNNANLS